MKYHVGDTFIWCQTLLNPTVYTVTNVTEDSVSFSWPNDSAEPCVRTITMSEFDRDMKKRYTYTRKIHLPEELFEL